MTWSSTEFFGRILANSEWFSRISVTTGIPSTIPARTVSGPALSSEPIAMSNFSRLKWIINQSNQNGLNGTGAVTRPDRGVDCNHEYRTIVAFSTSSLFKSYSSFVTPRSGFVRVFRQKIITSSYCSLVFQQIFEFELLYPPDSYSG